MGNVSGIDNPFANTENLNALVIRVQSLPGVAEYYSTPENKAMPFMKKGTYKFESR